MKNWTLIAALAGAYLLIAKPDLSKLGELIPNSITVPVVAAPSADLQTAVAPVTAVLKGHPAEAAKLSAYFADFAAVVKTKPDLLKTAGAIRQQHARASDLFLELNPASVPGISAAIDTALATMLGKENAPVDSTKAANALNALSWACAGAK